MEIENERLINAVSNRPNLWNSELKVYNNRNITEKLWNEISHELGENKTKVKKKWKGLRDTFRFELRKYIARNVNNPAFDLAKCQYDEWTGSQWIYFKSLYFLKNHINIRKELGINKRLHRVKSNETSVEYGNDCSNQIESPEIRMSMNSAEQNELSTLDRAIDDDNISESRDTKPFVSYEPMNCTNIDELQNYDRNILTNEFGANSTQSGKRKRATKSDSYARSSTRKRIIKISERLLELKAAQIEIQQREIEIATKRGKSESLVANNSTDVTTVGENEDEDQHFLKSLLPHIRKMTPARKMQFRIDVQKLIFDCVYNGDQYTK